MEDIEQKESEDLLADDNEDNFQPSQSERHGYILVVPEFTAIHDIKKTLARIYLNELEPTVQLSLCSYRQDLYCVLIEGPHDFISDMDTTFYGEFILGHPFESHVLHNASDWAFVSATTTRAHVESMATSDLVEWCKSECPHDMGSYKALALIIDNSTTPMEVMSRFTSMIDKSKPTATLP